MKKLNIIIMFFFICFIILIIFTKKNEIKKEVEYIDNIELEEKIVDTKNYKYIALTFDDGPGNYIKEILDKLNKYNYKATFFIVKNNIYTTKISAIKKLIDNNNEIGCHGSTHKSFTSLKLASVDKEINDCKNYIKEKLSYDVLLTRPPYGNINNKILEQNNGPFILWSIDTLDWKTKDPEKIYEEIINNVSDGDIILMHEIYETTVESLDKIFQYLEENDYKLVTVSELAKIKNIDLETNKKYISFK